MYREIFTQLQAWQEKQDRKIMYLTGAKGVGKTWTLNDFGMGFYGNTAYFDLESQEYARFVFEGELEKARIIKMLGVTCGENIEPKETLIVLENIDSLPDFSKLVKFMYDEMKEYHICITTRKNEERILIKFEEMVECVDVIKLYPLSFSEFLRVNQEDDLCVLIEENSKRLIETSSLTKIKEYLKTYMLLGGMPSVVKTYVETESISEAEAEKSNLIFGYMNEFEAIENKAFRLKVKQVFESVAEQLKAENKKFQYGSVKITARAREYKDAVEYLIENKYVSVMYRIKDAVLPLKKQKDEKSFELFFNDIGILSAMYGLKVADFEDDKILMERNGALALQYVYEELMHNPNVNDIYYWISQATAKIDFVFEDGDNIIPIEINLNENTKAQSLKVYRERYKNNMSVRITNDSMSISGGILNLPLFSIWNL